MSLINWSHDNDAVFAVTAATGRLKRVGYEPTRVGDTRSNAFALDEMTLFVCDHHDNSIVNLSTGESSLLD